MAPASSESTPPSQSLKNGNTTAKKRPESNKHAAEDGGSLSCCNCRPHVPSEKGCNHKSVMASPNTILKSILSPLTKKSPKPLDGPTAAREEQWKIAVAELSHKLVQAVRKREEALREASRLKYAMDELEKKLKKLEVYCHNFRSGFEKRNAESPVIEQFLISVSESRSATRVLARSLAKQRKQTRNPRDFLFHLEALINKIFYQDFESAAAAAKGILNPIDRCESNYAAFIGLEQLTWEEVLRKGTRHYSEEFSRFCDRKMSEIVAILGWNRAWPEQVLQAFFAAAKWVWLVELLAFSVHPGLEIFRVEKGVRFEPVYMEDVGGGGDKGRKMGSLMVRVMVAPGFYVGGNVVKCKVMVSV